jgi:uncharacterized protein YqeY
MKEKLQSDMKEAMKARDQLRLATVRGVISEIKLAEINSRETLGEEQCVAIVQKEIKKRRDALEFAQKAARAEMIEQNEAEIKILQGYLGEQLTEAQLRELINKLIAEGADNVGKIMGSLSKTHKGKFEGKSASEIAKQILG